jgi:hypothetical protein
MNQVKILSCCGLSVEIPRFKRATPSRFEGKTIEAHARAARQLSKEEVGDVKRWACPSGSILILRGGRLVSSEHIEVDCVERFH